MAGDQVGPQGVRVRVEVEDTGCYGRVINEDDSSGNVAMKQNI